MSGNYFQTHGINPGKCSCCDGEMIFVKNIPNQFYSQQRAPPVNDQLNQVIKNINTGF